MLQRRRSVPYPLVLAAVGSLTVAACSDRSPPPVAPLQPEQSPSLGIGVGNEANGAGQCMVDDVNSFTPGGPTNCTANDIRIATAYLTGGGSFQCTPGSNVTVNITAELEATSNAERQDIGVWISTDGGNARTGACNHYNLIPGSTNTVNGDGDQCAGMAAEGDPNPRAILPLGTLTLPCNQFVTVDNQTFLHVGSCIAWTVPGQDDVCSDDRDNNGTPNQSSDFRAATVPGTPAKCNCEGFNIAVQIVGKITIVKNAIPDNAQNFSFAHTVGTNSSPTVGSPFLLDDDGDPTLSNTQAFTNVIAGSYTFTETPVTGWTLSTPTCVVTGTATAANTTAATNGITVNLAPGQDVTCTFTNTASSSLDIEKQSIGGTGTFEFVSSGGGMPSSLSRNTATANPTTTAPIAFTGADAVGDKYVTETVPAGYLLTAINCTNTTGATIVYGTGTAGTFAQGATAGFDAGDNAIRVSLTPGAAPSCTFVNTASASLDIEKQSVGGTETFDFTATGTGIPATFTRNTATANPTTTAPYALTGSDVTGDKIIVESPEAGWTLTNIACTNTGATVVIGNVTGGVFTNGATTGYDQGDNAVKVTPAAGSTTSCTFTNTRNASLDIEKQTTGGTGSFDFTGSGTGVPGAFSRNTAVTNPTTSAPFDFTGFQLGDKYVSETVPAGWRLTGISCTANGATIVYGTGQGGAFNQNATAGFDPGDNTVKVTIVAGSTPACTFQNLLLATLTLNKTENGGLPLSRAWEFQLRTGASTLSAGTVVASASANVTTGVVTFPGYFTPGTYQLCEINMPAGYSNNITGFTPLGATPEGGDNSTECIDITLVSGANGPGGILGVPNPINNQPPPGGDARTIGYWKNWASCATSKGGQYERAKARGDFDRTLDANLTLNIGTLNFVAGDPSVWCEEARDILDKRDIVTGKKRASDPLFNMAAQLLAAKLNINAGADPSCIGPTITLAEDLLDKYAWNGTGNYNISPTDAALANQYAAKLDDYNNNTLVCP